MLAVERSRYILDKLKNEKVVLVGDLSKEIEVSEETIRKDLEKLEKQEQIIRVHGGAYLREGYGNETAVNVREQIFREEKAVLGERCMQFIRKNETIILDCSTTARYIAKEIVKRDLKISVITNSLATAYELSQSAFVRVILLGGELDNNTGAFTGNIVLEELNRYHADKVFISSAGISEKAGLTDYRQGEAEVRRKMIEQADQCYFVADTTKIGLSAMFVVGGVECIQHLIVQQSFKQQNLELYEVLEREKIEIVSCDFMQEGK